jgi:hypothetical protein
VIRRFIFQTALVCAACLLAGPSASAATAVGNATLTDDVSFAAAAGVPEPGTATLLAIAGALMVLWRARRRNFRLIATSVVTPSSALAGQ